MWLVMPFTAVAILHHPYYSIATYIQTKTQLSIIKCIYLKWFTICSQLFFYYHFFISAVTVLATSIWMICHRRDLPCKQCLFTVVLVNNTYTEPDYKNDLILCIVFYAVSTIIMTACLKTQRRAHVRVQLFPYSFQPAYFILASFVGGIKKLGAEAFLFFPGTKSHTRVSESNWSPFMCPLNAAL